ncbi:protein kinase C-binding protein NELL2-like [Acropora millepora]|uniref:protein kinase C-binding protein NELL2-like n=1 Tax=Acropora millepora TaxID=45264 RepID=UPI001CF3B3E7|nr:protein kinase C-binding protein NELL2-like [Acropora millepora]
MAVLMMTQFRVIFLVATLISSLLSGTHSSDPNLVDKIEMFKAVGLLNKQFTGVTHTSGKLANGKAFHFTDKTTHLIASQEAYNQANKLIHNSHDFSIFAWAKIDSDPSAIYRNTIVSISSKAGSDLFLLVMIEGKQRGTGLKVTVSVQDKRGSRPQYSGETNRLFEFKKWHNITVRFQDAQSLIRIFVDDKMIVVKEFRGFDIFPDDAQLRLAQVYAVDAEDLGAIKDRFTGDLQDVKFIRGTSLDDCPPLDRCQCTDIVGRKSCVMEGLKFEDGQRWKKDKCTVCDCKSGQVICTHICQTCNDTGVIYLQGETWKAATNSCLDCRCEKGKSICSPPNCPVPDCTSKKYKDLVIPEGKCCPVCKEDQCMGTGKEYRECGCKQTCSNFEPSGSNCNPCSEGCFCPRGQVLNDRGQCVAPIRCPCTYNGETYQSGQGLQVGPCKMCKCFIGKMFCFPTRCRSG